MTPDELERVRRLRWKGPEFAGVTKADVALLVTRVEELSCDDYSAEEIMRRTLNSLEEDLRTARAYLADQIEMTRIAELQVRESEKARDAVKGMVDGGMFTSGDEVNRRWDAMEALYRAEGLLPQPEPVDAVEPPVEALPPPPEPEPTPEPVEPLPPCVQEAPPAPAKAPPPPVEPGDHEDAAFASLKAAAGDKPEIQISLSVLAAHSGVPKGSLVYVLKQLAFANRIEIISAPNTKGAKPPNTYRFVVEAAPEPDPPKVEEPQAEPEPPPAPVEDTAPAVAPSFRPPVSFAKKVTDSSPIRDRIVATLRKAACTTSGLASMLDVKELAICQTLTAMEHEGSVKPDEMPEAGRRAQLWRLADAA